MAYCCYWFTNCYQPEKANAHNTSRRETRAGHHQAWHGVQLSPAWRAIRRITFYCSCFLPVCTYAPYIKPPYLPWCAPPLTLPTVPLHPYHPPPITLLPRTLLALVYPPPTNLLHQVTSTTWHTNPSQHSFLHLLLPLPPPPAHCGSLNSNPNYPMPLPPQMVDLPQLNPRLHLLPHYQQTGSPRPRPNQTCPTTLARAAKGPP